MPVKATGSGITPHRVCYITPHRVCYIMLKFILITVMVPVH